MAHFFLPSHSSAAQGEVAADKADISELTIDPAQAYVRVGLWGGAADGSKLIIKVHRNAVVVSEGKMPAVKIQAAAYDAGRHIQVVTLYGLKGGDFVRAWDKNGLPQTAPLPTLQLASGAPSVMKSWAAALASKAAYPLPRGLCPFAAPYLALSDAKFGKMPELKASCVGSPINNVHGLAVHCTAGNDASNAFKMAAWRCVPTWNKNGASAHFGIAGDGALVQFVPASHIAYAQGSPGNTHWISVEVDNDGKAPMNGRQFDTLKSLFRWVVNNYGVPPAVATGCLFPKTSQFDKVTSEACTATTESGFEAIMSRGLSCHWWLEPTKGKNSHACPGPGIIEQLPDLV